MNAKKAEMIERIRQHGQNLLAIFPNATDRDPVSLCKKLRGLESRATRITTALCNGETNDKAADDALNAILVKVTTLLGNHAPIVPVFINRDPRGYALKISDEWLNKQRSSHKTAYKAIIHRDMGGYGIIAPDLTD